MYQDDRSYISASAGDSPLEAITDTTDATAELHTPHNLSNSATDTAKKSVVPTADTTNKLHTPHDASDSATKTAEKRVVPIEIVARKVGKFSKDEHHQFREGVVACGWGKWSGIAKFHLPTRDQQQIRDHAIKLKKNHSSEVELLLQRNQRVDLNHEEKDEYVGRDQIEDDDAGNDSFYYQCSDDGQLICCDSCTKSFHLQCTSPQLDEIPTGDWFCQFCSKSEYEQLRENNIARNQERLMMLGLANETKSTMAKKRRYWTEDEDRTLFDLLDPSSSTVDM